MRLLGGSRLGGFLIRLSQSSCCHFHSMLQLPQDHVLPYITDPRHAPDTLFFVAEEDWRLFEADKKGLSQSPSDDPEDFEQPDWGAPGLPEEDVDEEDVPMSSDNLPHLFKKRATGAAASSSEGPVQPPLVSGYQHLGNRWYKRTRKAKADEFVESLSPHIVDLVKVMTAAHREGHGDIVWLAYEAARRGDDNRYHRDDRPNFGSQLIGISRAGALSLQEEWYRMRLGHFDLSLKHVLVNKEGVRTSIRSCFAYPSVGHYMTKESGVMQNPVDRVAAWAGGCTCSRPR